jgi:NADP-dependent 3-hydroxy acid dehydrogenase YdfG
VTAELVALAAETAGRIGVTLIVPGDVPTALNDRDDELQPQPDAVLNDHDEVARAVRFALSQPQGCELRELVVAPSLDPSWT